MTDAPMTRDQQIAFMKNAAKRRAQRHARWNADEDFKNVLRQKAEYRDHASTHRYSEQFLKINGN